MPKKKKTKKIKKLKKIKKNKSKIKSKLILKTGEKNFQQNTFNLKAIQ